ncbi:hypothetical protein LEP1GSC186_3403 [Leptospira noguchii serovar Autumnalis str. ZUN142]|uniref:Uncharacterized protein n=2 Tax=Leptospira noguchii TaxID=28182 RepID=M6YR24_9LEPT|nr:hypothetical protein LEP1GSC186_3403 [Leptospira noguchii serovar Autumnalis str. ZUN142]EMO88793.1 hypothetical protein LEP1GSC024_0140 [Leptospira noguchii str. 2001034031]
MSLDLKSNDSKSLKIILNVLELLKSEFSICFCFMKTVDWSSFVDRRHCGIF